MQDLGASSGTQRRAALLTIYFVSVCIAAVLFSSLLTKIADLESTVDDVRITAEDAKSEAEDLNGRVDDVESSIESMRFQSEFQ